MSNFCYVCWVVVYDHFICAYDINLIYTNITSSHHFDLDLWHSGIE